MKLRPDALGLFWRDEPPPPKVKKEKIKRTPPEPVWLNDDYLPYLEEARAMRYDCLTDAELVEELIRGTVLEFDIETYVNYTLIGFRTYDERRKYIIFEQIAGTDVKIDIPKLKWIMGNFTMSGFNNKKFDNAIALIAMTGADTYQIADAARRMIVEELQPWIVCRQFNVSERTLGVKFKFIDLMNVAPRSGSLKKYAARCGIERIQDLPFPPDKHLSEDQRTILKWYWANDLACNEILHDNLLKQIDMRVKMGRRYHTELRDKSDAQIAEAVFVAEKERLTGERVQKVDLDRYRGTMFRYIPPAYLQFKSPVMQEVFQRIIDADFRIDYDAKIDAPALQGENALFTIGNTNYKIGIGGLHSQEKSRYFISANGFVLRDHDVTSYYPDLILKLGMYPEAIGPVFLRIYQGLKDDRVIAKRTQKETHKEIQKLRKKHGNQVADSVLADINELLKKEDDAKVLNESGKIVINGSFGKFGDAYSALFAPNLLIQTTVTGQLTVLMLIERLELAGIAVVSANTDGLVTYAHTSQEALLNEIIAQWEVDTQMGLEHAEYKGLFSRDVNGYFAIKADGEVKGKGPFAISNLELDPKYEIAAVAAMQWCVDGTPLRDTVYSCKDMQKFVMVKAVNGGAVCDGKYYGKLARYYKSTQQDLPEMVNAKSGNLVPQSTGCKPLPVMKGLEPDIDYEWYVEEARNMLLKVGIAEEHLPASNLAA